MVHGVKHPHRAAKRSATREVAAGEAAARFSTITLICRVATPAGSGRRSGWHHACRLAGSGDAVLAAATPEALTAIADLLPDGVHLITGALRVEDRSQRRSDGHCTGSAPSSGTRICARQRDAYNSIMVFDDRGRRSPRSTTRSISCRSANICRSRRLLEAHRPEEADADAGRLCRRGDRRVR